MLLVPRNRAIMPLKANEAQQKLKKEFYKKQFKLLEWNIVIKIV